MAPTCIFNVKKKTKRGPSKMTSLREFNPLILSELDLRYASRNERGKKHARSQVTCKQTGIPQEQTVQVTKTNILLGFWKQDSLKKSRMGPHM